MIDTEGVWWDWNEADLASKPGAVKCYRAGISCGGGYLLAGSLAFQVCCRKASANAKETGGRRTTLGV